MLALRGTASDVRGFASSTPSHLIRIREPQAPPQSDADAAIVRTPDEAELALAGGFGRVVFVSDGATELDCGPNVLPHLLTLPKTFDYLGDGDIIALHAPSKRIRSLYRRRSAHNSFLVTERCNHYCLMCSQPPRDVDDGWILDEIKQAIPLVDPDTKSFAFTGGEPLTDPQGFIDLLDQCRTTLPLTAIHVLTNGRAFANTSITAAWAKVGHPQLMAGIPIYSAVDHIHDHVVQARGAFDETVLGVLKLKDRGQRVEVRVVLHALTAPRIVETCTWLARNLPFVDHVALMGLENTGFALANDDQLWIDPLDYQDDLAKAVAIVAAAGMRVSVYNLTRCVLSPSVWPHAIQSISDWKNDYVHECHLCVEKPRCSGFFTSGRPRHSRGVKAIRGAASKF
jgi:His-Xaa-Ser system radical SAM maturase HxsC